MRVIALLAAMALASPAMGQVLPIPSDDNPRLQTAEWRAGERITITALPGTALTVMLEPGDEIRRVRVSDDRFWAIKVSSELDSFAILPEANAQPANLTVETTRRTHEFHLQAEASLMAAYLVQLQFGPRQQPEAQVQLAPSEQRWSYKIRGDRQVRPADIMDDGAKTWISFADGQPLPAIFAIGPSGKEQVVNGYMRGDQFVIDRVHEQLIFRIDKKKAQARRGAAMELGG